MSSGFLKKARKRINVRLAALFTGIVLAISLFLSGFTFFLLSSSLKRKDHEALRSRVLELYAHYLSGGVAGLAREVVGGSFSEDRLNPRRNAFLVQLSDSRGYPLFTSVPEYLGNSDMASVKVLNLDKSTGYAKIRVGGAGGPVLEAVLLRFTDGNVLQVGMSIDERLAILERFRDVTLIVLVPLVCLSFTGGSVLASRLLGPLRSLGAAVRTVIDTGNVRSRIPSSGEGSELDDLVALFNTMLARIESLVSAMRGSLDSVAHELRTPMARLRGMAEAVLGASSDPKRLREALETSMEESERVLRMLNSLMDISEAETGIMKLSMAEQDLSTLVEEVVEIYRYAAEEKGVEIASMVPPRISAPVDRNRMRQVIANLLDNAIKYTPAGGRVRVSGAMGDGEAEIRVEDTGTGIRPEEMDLVWERLYRGEGGKTHPGLGLGLSFVKAIVEAHGGRVGAESVPGTGSRFSVFLPVMLSKL